MVARECDVANPVGEGLTDGEGDGEGETDGEGEGEGSVTAGSCAGAAGATDASVETVVVGVCWLTP